MLGILSRLISSEDVEVLESTTTALSNPTQDRTYGFLHTTMNGGLLNLFGPLVQLLG